MKNDNFNYKIPLKKAYHSIYVLSSIWHFKFGFDRYCWTYKVMGLKPICVVQNLVLSFLTFLFQFCEYSGGILAEIQDEYEQREVELFLEQNAATGAQGYWIGLTDISHEGHWTWISSGKVAEYQNWHRGEPYNFNGKEHFAHLRTSYEWNDCPNTGGHPNQVTICDYNFHGLCQHNIL